eukprot:CAMPEP_0204338204 /NCGR_PEP_ID=MMETSP0469-20131031/20896_1 /ASSEMBLY_ACC=CAM_ASM_000384 /TAXON_ID=2969 /ORGANISM="Oxyrrhis marina" /LENGTH=93 /DNA_ID=CAMNT_0051322345 /DNA_START=527 /DNA_END=806 /DNA_ORIENTATION=+
MTGETRPLLATVGSDDFGAGRSPRGAELRPFTSGPLSAECVEWAMDARETAVETSALAHGPWLEPCDETLAATLRIDCRGRAGAPAGARVSNL